MDKKSLPKADQPRAEKIFFLVMGVLILGSVAVSYYRYMVKQDYIIQAQADCDPYMEACFVHVCDPNPDVDGDSCTGDLVEDTAYYKLIYRNAKNIPLCDPSAEGCDALICPKGETDCSYTLCDPATVIGGDVCNDPVVYTQNNLIIEDAVEVDDEEASVNDNLEEEAVSDGVNVENEGDETDVIPIKE